MQDNNTTKGETMTRIEFISLCAVNMVNPDLVMDDLLAAGFGKAEFTWDNVDKFIQDNY